MCHKVPHARHLYDIKGQMSTRSSATAEISRDADDAIQGHSRSSVVVPIDAVLWLPISTQ